MRVGLTEEELGRFDIDSRKLGQRDLGVAVAQRAVGATTVGGTLAVARAVGIRFMGTGGLGGVHRGWAEIPDVSADLGELARTEVLVVSSGVKSLLDVPATAELLETLGVPVLGFRVDTLPLFYAPRAGRRSRRGSSRPTRPPRSRRRTGARRRAGCCSAARRTRASRTSSR